MIFPRYNDAARRLKLESLRRLLQTNLFATQFIDARSAAALIATCLAAYRDGISHPLWDEDPALAQFHTDPSRFCLVFASIFDLVCNAEYIHGRVVSDRWIYCHRDRGDPEVPAYAYYSFLKQCPRCSLDLRLDPRITGAQHKPSSHHIWSYPAFVALARFW
jgi:hypothetical protein